MTHQSDDLLINTVIKRKLWLSENSTNSKNYCDQDLAAQAAGFANT
jgi:hypothetical protein